MGFLVDVCFGHGSETVLLEVHEVFFPELVADLAWHLACWIGLSRHEVHLVEYMTSIGFYVIIAYHSVILASLCDSFPRCHSHHQGESGLWSSRFSIDAAMTLVTISMSKWLWLQLDPTWVLKGFLSVFDGVGIQQPLFLWAQMASLVVAAVSCG